MILVPFQQAWERSRVQSSRHADLAYSSFDPKSRISDYIRKHSFFRCEGCRALSIVLFSIEGHHFLHHRKVHRKLPHFKQGRGQKQSLPLPFPYDNPTVCLSVCLSLLSLSTIWGTKLVSQSVSQSVQDWTLPNWLRTGTSFPLCFAILDCWNTRVHSIAFSVDQTAGELMEYSAPLLRNSLVASFSPSININEHQLTSININ